MPGEGVRTCVRFCGGSGMHDSNGYARLSCNHFSYQKFSSGREAVRCLICDNFVGVYGSGSGAMTTHLQTAHGFVSEGGRSLSCRTRKCPVSWCVSRALFVPGWSCIFPCGHCAYVPTPNPTRLLCVCLVCNVIDPLPREGQHGVFLCNSRFRGLDTHRLRCNGQRNPTRSVALPCTEPESGHPDSPLMSVDEVMCLFP